jgi:hypothetical protein
MTARAGYRCGLFIARCMIREKKTDAPRFSCFRPVIVLLFAAPASNKAHKYGVICAPACIFPCCLQQGAGATRELIARRLGNNGMGGAFLPLYEASSAALSATRRAGS